MDHKKFLTLAEVASEFGLDEAALQQFVDSGEVQALADRGTWKYRRDELQSLIDSGKISPPTAEVWLDEGPASSDQVLTVNTGADDDLSYIELDEEALAEHATMISKSSPLDSRTPDEDLATEDWFVPSNVDEMQSRPTDPMQSSNEVSPAARSSMSDSVFDHDEPSWMSDSDSDVRLAGAPSDLVSGMSPLAAPRLADSDSDVQIAGEIPGGMLDGSGIVLDFDLGAGATVSSAGSSLRLPQTGAGDDHGSSWDEIDDGHGDASGAGGISLPDSSISRMGGSSATGGSSAMGGSSATGGSSTTGDSSIRLSDDSGIRLYSMEESGIALDVGSHIGAPMPGSSVASRLAGSSVVSGMGGGGSGLDHDDSGLSLTAEIDDSGLSLESVKGDSGLSLEEPGSGLTLAPAGDSGFSLTSSDKTLADDDFAGAMLDDAVGKTQELDLSNQMDDDSSFDMNLSDTGATAELLIDEEDDFEDTAATVVKKGRGKNEGPGLTEAFQLDDAPQVEDLDIAEDLDAGLGDEEAVVEIDEEEEVFEASDDVFSDEIETADDNEEYLAPAAKDVGPREPSWGTGMSVGLIVCSLVLAANMLILWSGVSTMWNGADAKGPAASLITQLAGLINS